MFYSVLEEIFKTNYGFLAIGYRRTAVDVYQSEKVWARR